MRIAPKTVYGIDPAGVRRRIPRGHPIPDALDLEEPLPAEDRRIPEQKVLAARQQQSEVTTPNAEAVAERAAKLAEEPMDELRRLAAERDMSVPVGTRKVDLAERLAAEGL